MNINAYCRLPLSLRRLSRAPSLFILSNWLSVCFSGTQKHTQTGRTHNSTVRPIRLVLHPFKCAKRLNMIWMVF